MAEVLLVAAVLLESVDWDGDVDGVDVGGGVDVEGCSGVDTGVSTDEVPLVILAAVVDCVAPVFEVPPGDVAWLQPARARMTPAARAAARAVPP
ncbi:MAG: hypothetical protein BGO26_14235 [Actinobacteria bacterium 69-20]|nr:hypothetical protein [Actinomycetota bacterium]OJV29485.1 MAG: hypothetical protein BGO26_14235 [Actinobacteria bacterium 69-20]